MIKFSKIFNLLILNKFNKFSIFIASEIFSLDKLDLIILLKQWLIFTSLNQVTWVQMVTHMIKEQLNWAHCETAALLKSQWLAIIYHTDCFCLFSVKILYFVELEVNIWSIRNERKLKWWVYLSQKVCNVGIVSGVKTISGHFALNG